MKIWKYPLTITDIQTVNMPAGAKILTAQMQGHNCCLWAHCKEGPATESRRIAIYGTGDPMPDDAGTYISTIQVDAGALIFHVFEAHPT